MPSRRTGHFVEIWRPMRKPGEDVRAVSVTEWEKQRKEVLGRSVSVFRHVNTSYATGSVEEGWQTVSRELPRRKARKIASAYKKAGFPSRVFYFGGNGSYVTDTFGEVKG